MGVPNYVLIQQSQGVCNLWVSQIMSQIMFRGKIEYINEWFI